MLSTYRQHGVASIAGCTYNSFFLSEDTRNTAVLSSNISRTCIAFMYHASTHSVDGNILIFASNLKMHFLGLFSGHFREPTTQGHPSGGCINAYNLQ